MRPMTGNLAYGVDMAMTASGKGNALVELMAHVFVSCECELAAHFFAGAEG